MDRLCDVINSLTDDDVIGILAENGYYLLVNVLFLFENSINKKFSKSSDCCAIIILERNAGWCFLPCNDKSLF